MSIKTLYYKIKRKALGIFGDIKLLPFPPYIYYQKGDYYKVSGADTLEAMSILQPGDIVLRDYDDYLDGKFIPKVKFSHAGIYVGNNLIIHAVTEGVVFTNTVDFFRCDRFGIMRPNVAGDVAANKKAIEYALARVHSWLGLQYDINFEPGNDMLYCFEVAAEAYRETLNIQKVQPGGLAKFFKVAPKYLDTSFLYNANLEMVLTAGHFKPAK